MTVTLTKGGNMLLADEAPGITEVRVGLGWSAGPGAGAVEIDGIVSLAEDGAPGRLLLTHHVPNPDEPVSARPAEAMPVGDAERLVVRLAAVPASISRLTFGAAIYDAANRRQTFRSIRGAYVRVLNHANGIEVARYTLDVETGSETAMVFGELYRHARGWKFRAVGQGYAAGLRGIVGPGDPVVVRPVEVTDYLRRISPARTRRSVTELLNPPAARPAPSTPTQPPTPTRPPAPPEPPAAPRMQPQPSARAQSTPASTPAHPTPAAAPPARQPPAQPAARSTLDLSEPEQDPATSIGSSGGGGIADRNGAGRGARIEYGEHSSRRRQREEHVSVLDDQHPATTWTEADRGTGAMTVTLTWEPLKTASGLPRPSDLHLAVFWQANDGSSGLMQPLGGAISAPGAAGPRQVLRLGRRDEREGQTLFVDLATLPSFKRFFVFAFGQHGSPEWPLLRPMLTVAAPSGEQLTMHLGEAMPGARLCVIASFHVVQEDLVLRRENAFVAGPPAEAAAWYGFAFDWNPDGITLRTPGR